MFLNVIFVITIFIPVFIVDSAARTVECEVYSYLKDERANVIHVTSSSSDDVIHYLWCSYYLPSIIVLKTTKDTNLTVDLEKLHKFEKGAIVLSKEPLASTGLTITQLWQYSYNTTVADIKDVNEVIPLNLDTFQWKNISSSSVNCSNTFFSINLVSLAPEEIFSAGGTFELEFSVSGIEESASDYPHLIYTGNSTQIKVVFNNFYSNYSRVRYGMELSVFAQTTKKCINETCYPVVTKSVSDEFSPGVFSDVSLYPICSKDSFLSWRPVAYISVSPSVANSTDAKMTSECSESIIKDPQSIAELYFSEMKNFSVTAFNMTFGTAGDGFYTKTKYTMWSFMVGVGRSVGFKMSLTAIIYSSVGLGVLFLFIAAGLIFVSVQRCQKKTDDQKQLISSSLNQ